MLITAELLRKYKGCEQGIKYIERFYPNGAEMIDIIRDRHINKEFLHWGREHLTHTAEELEAYCEACKIVNTDGFWYSVDVSDSKSVVKSKNVQNGIGIFGSTDVAYSTDIVNSENVTNGHQIFYSTMIDDCEKIYKGINIVNCVNICFSTMVANSRNVIDSKNVFDSSEIIKCNTVTDSHFCQNCTNIENCLFCYDLHDAQYCIFNKPVDKNRYEMIARQYQKYMDILLAFMREWPCELLVEMYVAPTRKFDDWYTPISDKFWKWARTLPGYDSMMLYNITMLPEILVD